MPYSAPPAWMSGRRQRSCTGPRGWESCGTRWCTQARRRPYGSMTIRKRPFGSGSLPVRPVATDCSNSPRRRGPLPGRGICCAPGGSTRLPSRLPRLTTHGRSSPGRARSAPPANAKAGSTGPAPRTTWPPAWRACLCRSGSSWPASTSLRRSSGSFLPLAPAPYWRQNGTPALWRSRCALPFPTAGRKLRPRRIGRARCTTTGRAESRWSSGTSTKCATAWSALSRALSIDRSSTSRRGLRWPPFRWCTRRCWPSNSPPLRMTSTWSAGCCGRPSWGPRGANGASARRWRRPCAGAPIGFRWRASSGWPARTGARTSRRRLPPGGASANRYPRRRARPSGPARFRPCSRAWAGRARPPWRAPTIRPSRRGVNCFRILPSWARSCLASLTLTRSPA